MSSQELLGQVEKNQRVEGQTCHWHCQLSIKYWRQTQKNQKNQRLSWGWLSSLRFFFKTVVKRYDASLIESVTESAVQVIFQWGSYMGLSYLIGKVKNTLADFECFGEKDSSLAAVCLLKDTVAFRSNAFLWFSGLGSMVSLTLGQMKSHNVQHEFCTTLKMKGSYACAALMNTSSYILL